MSPNRTKRQPRSPFARKAVWSDSLGSCAPGRLCGAGLGPGGGLCAEEGQGRAAPRFPLAEGQKEGGAPRRPFYKPSVCAGPSPRTTPVFAAYPPISGVASRAGNSNQPFLKLTWSPDIPALFKMLKNPKQPLSGCLYWYLLDSNSRREILKTVSIHTKVITNPLPVN